MLGSCHIIQLQVERPNLYSCEGSYSGSTTSNGTVVSTIGFNPLPTVMVRQGVTPGKASPGVEEPSPFISPGFGKAMLYSPSLVASLR